MENALSEGSFGLHLAGSTEVDSNQLADWAGLIKGLIRNYGAVGMKALLWLDSVTVYEMMRIAGLSYLTKLASKFMKQS